MSQPISRVLSWIIIHLDSTSPQNSSNLPWPSQDWHKGLYLVLLQTGFTVPYTVTWYAVRSYRTFSPLPTRGGLFSVALSVDLHLPGVTWHLVQWSPDFPLKNERLSSWLWLIVYRLAIKQKVSLWALTDTNHSVSFEGFLIQFQVLPFY